MSEYKRNYYGSLCTEMYEFLHEKAPMDELQFYLSYAEKGMRILEPLCGSGRFLVPFLEYGFNNILTYSTYQKEIALNGECEMFLYECST